LLAFVGAAFDGRSFREFRKPDLGTGLSTSTTIVCDLHDIAIVISDLGSGGAQRVLVQLTQAWCLAGRRVTVITLGPADGDFFELPRDVTRIALSRIPPSAGLFRAVVANLKRVKQLRSALRSTRARIAIAFIAPTAVLTLFAAKGTGIRVIVCERNDPRLQSFGKAWDFLRKRFYRWADLVTANSRGAAVSLAEFVPQKKLAYVANPLRPPTQVNAAHLPAPTILSIGRLSYQKAHDVLLKAFQVFSQQRSDWRLAIMGEGPLEWSLKRLAEDLGISKRVDWLGTKPDPYPWLASARVFALASRHEGTPNALLEAMACGLPCIVSDASPGPLELVQHEVTGLIVPSEDHLALAAALVRLSGDVEFADRLGEAAQKRTAVHRPEFALQSWETALLRACGE
jgi:glycosyltransferase involved in cell wall biosynthesis